MPPIETLIAFAVATAIFAYIPGPALLYTAAQTLARGRRAGFMAAFGIHVGCYVHVLAAAFGLSAVFRHVPEAYLALKIVGAIYLVWLGIGLLRMKGDAALPAIAQKSPRRAFFDSIVVEVLNPKVALFFVAFLPQFVDPSASLPIWAQFLILGTLVNLAFSSADIATVLAASAMVERLGRSERAMGLVRKVGGGLMIALGLRLATDRT